MSTFATNLRCNRADEVHTAKTNGSPAPSSTVALRLPTTKSASPTKHLFLVRHLYNASNLALSHSKDGRAIHSLNDSGPNATTCLATTRSTTIGALRAATRDAARHSWSTSAMRARVAEQSSLCWTRRKTAGGVSSWIVTTEERALLSSLGREQLFSG